MKARGALLRFALPVMMIVALFTSVDTAAAALKVYNYGTNMYPWPWNNYDFSDGASRAGYWQDLTTGLYARWPVCSREWASSPFNNFTSTLTGAINISAHGSTDDTRGSMQVLFPPDGSDYYASTLYARSSPWTQSLLVTITDRNGVDVEWPSGNDKRIQDLGPIPANVKLAVFQGCQTGYYGGTQAPLAKQIVTEGVDTGVGFTGSVLIAGSSWPAGYTYQDRFNDGYWKSLKEHHYNSKAMDDGAEEVYQYFGQYGDYDTHARWGADCKF